MLMPHGEMHRNAPKQGPSYHVIARSLGTVKIRVSLDALSRFCREAIEQKPERKSPRSSDTASAPGRAETPLSETASPHAASDSPVLVKDENATEPAAQPHGKGPCTADPTNI